MNLNFVFVCLRVLLFGIPFVNKSVCVFVLYLLHVFMEVCMLVCVSLRLLVCLCVCLCVRLCVCVFGSLIICLSVCLYVFYLSVCVVMSVYHCDCL